MQYREDSRRKTPDLDESRRRQGAGRGAARAGDRARPASMPAAAPRALMQELDDESGTIPRCKREDHRGRMATALRVHARRTSRRFTSEIYKPPPRLARARPSLRCGPDPAARKFDIALNLLTFTTKRAAVDIKKALHAAYHRGPAGRGGRGRGSWSSQSSRWGRAFRA